MPLATIDQALEDYRAGRFVIVVDDEGREDEGDLCLAAEFATPEAIAFMAKRASGQICVPLKAERLAELAIPMMTEERRDAKGTAFTKAVDYKRGTTTGISAFDRSATIRALIDPASRPDDFNHNGHVFPLRYVDGGVLRRAGHTEASVDLAILAGLYPAAVICEVMNDDGRMAKFPDLERFADVHGIRIISVAQIIKHRRQRERIVRRLTGDVKMPTRWGEFTAYSFESVFEGVTHVALVMGDVRGGDPPLVRMHSECLTGDVFGSLRCDCGDQWQDSLRMIAAEGRGVAVYLRGQEGRGIGLHNKFRAYALQDKGMDTVEANEALGLPVDLRDYGVGAHILLDLGVREMRLITNNPQKIAAVEEGYGLRVVERIPQVLPTNEHNVRYMNTKRAKLHHIM
jgi:3,4-dihydroxy 2-butanone 4-phosphate synthase/GTP cyclohydrolase II